MKNKVLLLVASLGWGCLFVLFLWKGASAESSGSAVLDLQNRWDTYSPGPAEDQLKENLLDLKKGADELRAQNDTLSSRSERIQTRIPELKQELEHMSMQEMDSRDQYPSLKEELEREQENVRLMQKELADLENQTRHKDQWDVQFQSKIEQKERQEKALDEEIQKLRLAISHLKISLASENTRRVDPEMDRLRGLLQQSRQRVVQGRKQLNQLKNAGNSYHQWKVLKKEQDTLMGRKNTVEANLTNLLQQQNDLEKQISSRADEKTLQIQQLDSGLGQLQRQENEMLDLFKTAEETNQKIAKEFNSAQPELLKAINTVQQENFELEKQTNALIAYLDHAERLWNESAESQGSINEEKILEQKVEQFHDEHAQLLNELQAKTKEADMLERRLLEGKKEGQRLSQEVQSLSRANKKILEKEQKRFGILIGSSQRGLRRSVPAAANAQQGLVQLTEKQQELKEELVRTQQGLNSAIEAENELLQEKLAMGANQEQQLQHKIEKLKEQKNELEVLWNGTESQLRADTLTPAQFNREAKDLRTYLAVLESENEHLQEQMLNFMMVYDRLR